ncbi:hypothetical protein ACFYOG_32680 [Streptomyces sp. NPDC007818]|uniref:hypothetical protein n=1 Tax=Streptomyces sp. NPDC007818 TaxID=3364780 RepID=UPI00367F6770
MRSQSSNGDGSGRLASNALSAGVIHHMSARPDTSQARRAATSATARWTSGASGPRACTSSVSNSSRPSTLLRRARRRRSLGSRPPHRHSS